MLEFWLMLQLFQDKPNAAFNMAEHHHTSTMRMRYNILEQAGA
jgi:hypothetical protein